MRFLAVFLCVFSLGSIHAYGLSPNDIIRYVPPSPYTLFVRTVSANELESAEKFVDQMVAEGINVLATEGLSDADLQSKFRSLLKTKFDVQTIGRFAMGSYWRSASDAQQKDYLNLFEDMIVKVYSRRFADYNGEAVVIDGSRAEGKYDILVSSFIVPPSGQKIKVDWRVRKKNDTFKVVDVVVEGVSMAVTQRSEFSSVIQRGGGNVDILLDHLRTH